MITLEQAKIMFAEMVKNAEEQYEVFEVWEIKLETPIYVMTVIDKNGDQRMPGDPFKSIKKETGELIDFVFPCPA